MSAKPKKKTPNLEVRSSAPGKQAQKGLRTQTITVDGKELRIQATMGMLADQEAIYWDMQQDPSIVGAREGQPLNEKHETMCALFALVYDDASEMGLTPYALSKKVPLDQVNEIMAEVNSMVGQLPGSEEGNE